MSGQLLLVGSVPLDTPKEVFETFGAPLGRYLSAMPDGEVGPRRLEISLGRGRRGTDGSGQKGRSGRPEPAADHQDSRGLFRWTWHGLSRWCLQKRR